MSVLKQALLADQHSIALLREGLQVGFVEELVTPRDVASILNRYLHGDLTDSQLQEWADCLVSCDAYVSPDWQNDVSADFYEPMWDALQQLASPEIDGVITTERVERFVKKLEQMK
jgi:hypothetical protein